ncbi:LOW QUALITY PROTEIN: conserved hypothetical protein, partial [Streptomyces sp. SPB78]
MRSEESCASWVCSSVSSVDRVAFCCPPPVSLVAIYLTPLGVPRWMCCGVPVTGSVPAPRSVLSDPTSRAAIRPC